MPARAMACAATWLAVSAFAPSTASQEAGQEKLASPASFKGKWVYEGSFELEGREHRVVHQLDLDQRGDRVCGCYNKVGAPSDRIDSGVLSGKVSGNVLDFYADA